MADFNIRADSVDVEQIMKQIRSRIRDKRGVDYTEDQIRELATVRLEKFLDPKNLRSDLLEQFRRSRPALPEPPKEPPPVEPPYTFDDQTLFASHRGLLVFIRRLFKPVLKLFFNPNTLNQVLHAQAQFNLDMLKRDLRRRVEFQQQVASFERSRAEWNVLYYEILHNLVLETTRNGIELKNMKMRLEALASRLDFSERRVRALEGVVQYRPEAVRQRPMRDGHRAELGRGAGRSGRLEGEGIAEGETATVTPANGESQGENSAAAPVGLAEPGTRRRRRRRRGRRGAGMMPASSAVSDDTTAPASSAAPTDTDLTASDQIGGNDDDDGDSTAADEAFENGDDLQPSEDTDPETPSDPDQQ